MSGEQNVVRLREPKNSVDRRAISWWSVQAVLEVAPVVLTLAVLALLLPPARPWLLVGLAVAVAIGLPYVLVMPRWRFRVHRWEATDDAVFARSGWLWQEWRVAPMSRIQTVDTVRGPLQQVFRLATVTVTTASAKGAVRIAGLDAELAARLAEELTETTQATPGDAT